MVVDSQTTWKGDSGTYDTSPLKISRGLAVWLFIAGMSVGILITLTVTILSGWLIDIGASHSSGWNRAFYGYALGCAPTTAPADATG